MSYTQKLKNKFYSGSEHPYKIFEDTICAYLNHNATVLDLGCGRDLPVLRKVETHGLKVGIDIFPMNNHHGVQAIQADICKIPLKDETFDIVISRSVLEHVEYPLKLYNEVHRLLKKDGRFVFLTPNFYDYASIISKLVPNKLHPKLVSISEGRDEGDVFPAYYKTNTKSSIKKLAQKSGLNIETISMHGQYPCYLMFNPILFLFGTGYDKLVSNVNILSFLRGWLLCVLQKNEVDRT